jgi:pimeloyl-ACP methyl ester carboxylesterase
MKVKTFSLLFLAAIAFMFCVQFDRPQTVAASSNDRVVVVFVNGICLPIGTNGYHDCGQDTKNPYDQGSFSFAEIQNYLATTGVHIDYKCFVYDSEVGVDCNDVTNVPSPPEYGYNGKKTWKGIGDSAWHLDRQLEAWRDDYVGNGLNPHFVIIGHSLGGAVAGVWAATSSDQDLLQRTSDVITMDSPVNGALLGTTIADAVRAFTWTDGLVGLVVNYFFGEFLQSPAVQDLDPVWGTVANTFYRGVDRVHVVDIADTADRFVLAEPDALFGGAEQLKVSDGPPEDCLNLGGEQIPYDGRVPDIGICFNHSSVLHSHDAQERIAEKVESAVPPEGTPPRTIPPAIQALPTINVVLSPAPNSAGWNNSPVSVSWVTSGADWTSGCGNAYVDYQTSGTTFTCTAGNDAGTRSRPVTIRLDSIPPTISGSRYPGPNPRGWNNTDVTVHFDCADERSGVAYCTPDQVISAEGRNQSRSGLALDVAGNSNSASVDSINIDKTPPVTGMTHVPTDPNGKRGWYVSDLTFTLDPQDPALTSGEPGSGIQYTKWRLNNKAWNDCTGPFTIGDEGWNTLQWYSVDNADNVEATHEFRFKLDKTPPVISIADGILDGLHWDQVHLERGILTNTSTLAVSGSASDNLCLWEVRAVDTDSNAVLASQQPVGANTPDWPPPYPPNSLAYSLTVPLHTGINNIAFVAEDCAGWEKHISTQIVYVIPGPYDPRSKGFWSNGVKTGKYTSSQMQTLLTYVNVVSDTWGPATRNIYGLLTMQNYGALLDANGAVPENMEKAQLLAVWLNLVSGRMAVLTPVNMPSIPGWIQVVDNTSGSPKTFALNVPMQIEEVDQTRPPAKSPLFQIAKNLAEGMDIRSIVP